ncbi:DUF4132 domain-containing protein, partial [Brachyspira innocens]|nr:DUF4132 domain-containing protein [Brachyspira innocens]
MSIDKTYIDDIFKKHPYIDNIKKYVYNETENIDFNPKEIEYSISNNHSIYSKLLDLYTFNKEDDSLIRLFKVISMHDIENIYIFEILIINIVSGLSIKEALLKCISLKKINDWNREYKRHSYNINPISNEIMNAKMNTFIYLYYAKKYFPKETEHYIDDICSSNTDSIVSEYKEDILIPLMAVTQKIYYGDYSNIDKLLEYCDKAEYLDAILSLILVIDRDEKIQNKFLYLFENKLLNENKDLLINLAYLVRLFFLTRKNLITK